MLPALVAPMSANPQPLAMSSIELTMDSNDLRGYPLKRPETIVGRDPLCDLLIDSQGVSRRHARIFRRDDQYFIDDLESINGTFLNRERVRKPTLLRDGDTIHFYRVSGVFRADGHVEAARPGDGGLYSPIESPTPAKSILRNTHELDATATDSGTHEQRLHAVLKVVESLGQSLGLDDVLANILDGLFEVFPQSRRGNIWLINEETGKPELRATKQTGSQTLCSDSFGPLASTISSEVISNRKAILSVDELNEDASESIFDFQRRSSICAPLTRPDGEVLGAICIDSDDGDNPFDEEDLEVLTGVTAVAGQAIEHSRQHERLIQSAVDFAVEKTRRERAEGVLQTAESIQRTLYPASNPEVDGFDIAGKAISTEKGCGDYFDFIPLADGRLLIAVGDVSGHGLGAALYMVQTRSYIRAHAAQGLEVSELLSRVNRLLCEDLVNGTFVTMFLAILDPVRRELSWSSAGHPGFRLNADDEIEHLAATNLVLGLIPDIVYESKTLHLNSGDMLALPTDGFYETQNRSGKFFGRDRMLDEITNCRHISSAEVIDSLCDSCREFAGDAPILDDMTCVLIKVRQA